MVTNADLTIFNRYVDPTTRDYVYQRAQVAGVLWLARKAANSLRVGRIEADAVTVFLMTACPEMATYKPPKEWQALADKTGYWTVQSEDIIARGLVNETIHPATEHEAAYTVRDLTSEYDNVLTVTSVDDMSAGSAVLQHLQIGAK